MEKIKEKTIEILVSSKAKFVIGTILLSIIGAILPGIFHTLIGSSAGKVFLPIHVAVLIAALTFGTTSSIVVGASSPVLSFLLSGMPNLARLPYTLIELVIYGIILSLLNKKFNRYISLIATIILGRIAYAIILFMAINLFGFETYGFSVIDSIVTGWPGIAIQLIFVPIIAKFTKESLNLESK